MSLYAMSLVVVVVVKSTLYSLIGDPMRESIFDYFKLTVWLPKDILLTERQTMILPKYTL